MPQPPPPPPPPPPLAIDADRRALHDLGYLELTKVPDWELLAFCERMHTRWHKRCAELLDGLRARWFEGCDEGARVGAVAARVATELLDEELFEAGGTHGIWLTPTPNPNPNPNPSPNPNPNPNPDPNPNLNPNPNPNPKQDGSSERRVVQMQTTTWPNYGVPEVAE